MTKDPAHLLTRETEDKLFKETILPILARGESLTAMWVRHSGRRRTCRFLAQNSTSFCPSNFQNHRIISVPHGDLIEETPQAFFQLMLSYLIPKINIQTTDEVFLILKREIERIVSSGWHLIFILERFDELVGSANYPQSFFNNLHNLWLIDKIKVHFIFACSTNIYRSDCFEKTSHLKELLSQNVVYFPLLQEKDNEACVQNLIDKYGYRVSQKQKLLIRKICGGHASLNRAALRLLSGFYSFNQEKVLDFLLDQYEIKIILEDIWNSFDENEKKAVAAFAQGNSFKSISAFERLIKLGIIRKEGKSWQLFSPVLAGFVASVNVAIPNLSINPQGGEVLINGLPAQEKITLQEYHLLSAFLKEKNNVLSRDQIALRLWGKDSEEKYSDWAIDQVISQLRNKLEKLGIPSSKLQTIRNRGYRWVD